MTYTKHLGGFCSYFVIFGFSLMLFLVEQDSKGARCKPRQLLSSSLLIRSRCSENYLLEHVMCLILTRPNLKKKKNGNERIIVMVS